MNRLLLISCSSTKREGAGGMPALDRYDGPKFRVLRKALGVDFDPPTIRILSSIYGLIGPDHPIGNYDLELTVKGAGIMAFARSARAFRGDFDDQIAGADNVFVMAGGLYLDVLRAWNPTASCSWRYAHGAPGERLQQLKNWLHNTNQGE